GIVDYKGSKHFIHAYGKIAEKGCLKCHSTREEMPKTLLAKYNPPYDPNWKEGELTGAVMVFVPFEEIYLRAQLNGLIKGLGVFSIFLVIVLFVLFMLNKLVFEPLETLQKRAEEIAQGNVDNPIEISSDDEIGKLAQSFERMRVSIKKVMDLLK
ncbi:MAG: HAMP domain-containing protein, partial [Aquificaceae bacterium]|nr:HAMP domain-containing protein [Aquificaceae bacterium]